MTTFSARSVAIAFVAGVIATLGPHQLLLKAVGGPAYSMVATWPFGVPEFLSLAFFGGLWAILIAHVVPRLPGALDGVLGWVVLGTIFPSLVYVFVVAPLKGLPMGVLLSPPYVFIIPLLNAVWGLFAWAFIKAADMAMAPHQESGVSHR